MDEGERGGAGPSEPELDAALPSAAPGFLGLNSSDRMSLRSLVPLECLCVEMCMSEEYAPSSQAVCRENAMLPLQRWI